jgi:hypothetical protein
MEGVYKNGMTDEQLEQEDQNDELLGSGFVDNSEVLGFDPQELWKSREEKWSSKNGTT